MEKFVLQNIQMGAGIFNFIAERPDWNGRPVLLAPIIYTISGESLSESFQVVKDDEGWTQTGHQVKRYDQDFINDLGDAIEDQDLEIFNNYDEEDELKAMGLDEETEEGFDWGMKNMD